MNSVNNIYTWFDNYKISSNAGLISRSGETVINSEGMTEMRISQIFSVVHWSERS